jgi:plasmid replication initiation protein
VYRSLPPEGAAETADADELSLAAAVIVASAAVAREDAVIQSLRIETIWLAYFLSLRF